MESCQSRIRLHHQDILRRNRNIFSLSDHSVLAFTVNYFFPFVQNCCAGNKQQHQGRAVLPRRPNFRQNKRSDVLVNFRRLRSLTGKSGQSSSSALPLLAGNKVENRHGIF
jgi:hypothetical protein